MILYFVTLTGHLRSRLVGLRDALCDQVLTSSTAASDSTRVCRFNRFCTRVRVTPNIGRVCYWREWWMLNGWARRTAKDFMSTLLSKLTVISDSGRSTRG